MPSKKELQTLLAEYVKHSVPVNKPMLDAYGLCPTLVYHKLLLESIQNFQEENGGWFYLKMVHICNASGFGRTKVWQALNILKENGLIEVKSENGKINFFRVNPFTKRTGPRSQSEQVLGGTSLYIKQIQNIITNTASTPPAGAWVDNGGKKNSKNTKTEQTQTAQSRSFAPVGGCAKKSKRTSIPGAQSAELRSSRGKPMRKTRPGQTRKDLLPTPRECQDLLPAPPPVPADALAKYSEEELEFAHSWYRYIKGKFTAYKSKKWKDLRIGWLKCLHKVTNGKNALCSLEELIVLLEWAKTDDFYSKNIRSLASLDKKWGPDKLPMIACLQESYEKAHAKSERKNMNEPLDVQDEIPGIVERTLLESYDGHEEYFDDLCHRLSETIASVWELLDTRNQQQSPADKQTWLYNKLFFEKCADIVRIWIAHSAGKDPILMDPDYGRWAKFRQRIERWKQNIAVQGVPGPWIIQKI